MDSLTPLLDALKATTYGALATLLPGAAMVELSSSALQIEGLVMKGGVFSYMAAAYVAGAALQGAAAFVFAFKPLRALSNNTRLRQSEEHAHRILEAKLGEDVSRERVLDLCLSHVEARRKVYDKFVALRDMSRALVLVSSLAAVVVVVRHPRELLTMQYGGALVGCLAVAAAFLERYRCFAPLGRQIVFAQFIAAMMKVKKKEPGTKKPGTLASDVKMTQPTQGN